MSKVTLILGALLLIGVIAMVWEWPSQVLFGYLAAWIFWLGVPIGAVAWLFIHRLTGGYWGNVLLDQARAAAKLLPIIALLMIPILCSIALIYPWAKHGFTFPPEEQHTFRSFYLSAKTFLPRAVIFLLLWIGISRVAISKTRNQFVCGFLLLILVLTVGFATLDWVGTLTPNYYSTMFGLYIMVTFGLTAMCVCILASVRFVPYTAGQSHAIPAIVGLPSVETRQDEHAVDEHHHEDMNRPRPHDWGNLMLAFVILHAYVAFSQFLITWSGNLPHEIAFYVPRVNGAWGGLALLLVIIQLFLPLVLLLFRKLKQNPRTLALVATIVLTANWLEAIWLVLPSVPDQTTMGTLIGIGVAIAMSIGIGLIFAPILPFRSPVALTRKEVA